MFSKPILHNSDSYISSYWQLLWTLFVFWIKLNVCFHFLVSSLFDDNSLSPASSSRLTYCDLAWFCATSGLRVNVTVLPLCLTYQAVAVRKHGLPTALTSGACTKKKIKPNRLVSGLVCRPVEGFQVGLLTDGVSKFTISRMKHHDFDRLTITGDLNRYRLFQRRSKVPRTVRCILCIYVIMPNQKILN